MPFFSTHFTYDLNIHKLTHVIFVEMVKKSYKTYYQKILYEFQNNENYNYHNTMCLRQKCNFYQYLVIILLSRAYQEP